MTRILKNSTYFEIEGIASTSTEDSYGEIINQKGIDLSFVSHGLVSINIEHGDDFAMREMSVVGQVTDAKITKDGLWIKGRIYYEHQFSKRIYKELLQANGTLQLSIEMSDCIYGDGLFSNIVLGGILTGVALTKDPANEDTFAKLVKSLNDPTLIKLTQELRRLNRFIKHFNHRQQRQQRKKKITVKILKVA